MSKRRIVGGALIVLAAVLNEWLLAALFSPDGHLASPLVRASIWAFQAVLVLVGIVVIAGRERLRFGSRRRAAAILVVVSTVLALAAAELFLRLAGHSGWQAGPVAIIVEPGGRLFTTDPELGYAHLPGRYEVTLPDGYAFHVTHLDNSLRATHPAADPGADREEIWVFGGSFTHGWTCDDEDSYPWQLQSILPEHEVVNFGVVGYGTLHSYLQFQRALDAGARPRAVVVSYADFHDRRNTFVRKRRKLVATWAGLGPLRQPRARIEADGELEIDMAEVDYRPLPLMGASALVHLLEEAYNNLEERNMDGVAISEAILTRFAREAQAQGIQFVVAGIHQSDRTTRMLDRCRSAGILATDISVDLDEPRNNNLPHDPHPSAEANKAYAEKLAAFLEQAVL